MCRVEQLQVMISAACCCKCCMHCTTVRQGRDTGDTVIAIDPIVHHCIGDIVIIHGWTNGFSPVKRYTLPDGLKKCQTTGPADIKQE